MSEEGGDSMMDSFDQEEEEENNQKPSKASLKRINANQEIYDSVKKGKDEIKH